ncbi:MAG: MmcQ/YjbR family DNA-binding protein [Deltaproteobacteria bacterium]|nr:MmcQ/YjbR family DNA-binding protein [Deltaproteobacteria bacterium]
MKVTAAHKAAFATLRAHALSLPGAWEDFPWGHTAIKVKKQIFAFLTHGEMEDAGETAVGLGVKLPQSNGQALALPFCKPTGYGLGKAGWVDISFGVKDDVPVDILTRWIDESYRAVAPTTLVKQLEAGGPTTSTSTPAPAPKKAAVKKAAAKKIAKKAITKKTKKKSA